jgi:hypothetical protein
VSYSFDVKRFFPRHIMDAINEARVDRPDVLEAAANRRARRAPLARAGRLNLLASDHPGREDPLVIAMAVSRIIHNLEPGDAGAPSDESRDASLDALTKYFP